MKKIFNAYQLVVGNLIILALVASFVVLILMLYNVRKTVRHMTKSGIEKTLTKANKGLTQFFNQLQYIAFVTRDQGKMGLFDNFSPETFNKFFIPYIENSPVISSCIIATEDGDEYMLIKKDHEWFSRITSKNSESQSPDVIVWRMDPSGKLVKVRSESLEKQYQPKSRPWFRGALQVLDSNFVFWTDPYIFFTTENPGITISTGWKNQETNKKYIVAFDIQLLDISNLTQQFPEHPHEKLFILTEDSKLLGLPKEDRFTNPESMKPFILKVPNTLGDPVIDMAIQIHHQNANNEIFSFDYGDDQWWAGNGIFHYGKNNRLIYTAIIPESDMYADIGRSRQLIVGGLVFIFVFFGIIAFTYIHKKRDARIIQAERDKNEKLLLNTLPLKVVNDLKIYNSSPPENFEMVTVLFSDLVGFTKISSTLHPKILINELNDIFTTFDEIIERNGCERIKTIGDAYLAVCGMPQKDPQHALKILKSAVEIMRYVKLRSQTAEINWKIRIGIHSGSVVGAMVGVKKYIYDVFGDTINTASRMESLSDPMKINLSESIYQLVRGKGYVSDEKLIFQKRPPMEVKGKGVMDMYFLEV